MREDGDLLLRAVVRTLANSVEELSLAGQPDEFNLYQNYPNPFNGGTSIRFELSETTASLLRIFGLDGRLLFEKSYYRAGAFVEKWNAVSENGEPLPSGVYLISLQNGDKVQFTKATLLR